MLLAFSSSGSHSFSSGSSFHSSSSFSSSGFHSAPSSSYSSFGSGYHSAPSTGYSYTPSAGSSGTMSQPTVVNHYYNNGGDAFWNYMFWNSMFNHPQYVAGGQVPYGYTVQGNQYVARPQTVAWGIISLLLVITVIIGIIILVGRSLRSDY